MSSMFGDAGVDMLLNGVLVIETKIKNIFQVFLVLNNLQV